MTESQKNAVLSFLGKANHQVSLCIPYLEYLDTGQNFTDFNGQQKEEKLIYLEAIERILQADSTAEIFVEVYGFEREGTANIITAETLWIETVLITDDISEVFQLMNEKYQRYYSPSCIGLLSQTDLKKGILVNQNGRLMEMSKVVTLHDFRRLIYCCWD